MRARLAVGCLSKCQIIVALHQHFGEKYADIYTLLINEGQYPWQYALNHSQQSFHKHMLLNRFNLVEVEY